MWIFSESSTLPQLSHFLQWHHGIILYLLPRAFLSQWLVQTLVPISLPSFTLDNWEVPSSWTFWRQEVVFQEA